MCAVSKTPKLSKTGQNVVKTNWILEINVKVESAGTTNLHILVFFFKI